MNPTILIQDLINGFALGSVYAIFALGYTLVFSILDVLNLTQGAMFTLGAYFTYVLTGAAFNSDGLLANQSLPFGLPFPLALLLGALLSGVLGIGIELVIFRPLRARQASSLLAMISSLGANIAIINLIQYLAGSENYSYSDPLLSALPRALTLGSSNHLVIVRTTQIILFIVAIVIVVLLTIWITRTKSGKALQAIAQDPLTSRLLGINPNRLILLTFFVSAVLGGVSGTLVGMNVSIAGPYFSESFVLKGLSVIIVGGLGSIPGTIAGGFALGIAESFSTLLLSSQQQGLKDAVAFVLLFIVLLIRPQGLLGKPLVQKV